MRCEYCDYRNPDTGWKEMNRPLLEYTTELAGQDVWMLAIIEDGYLQLDGECITMDKLKIHYCPMCGRRLDKGTSDEADIV